MLVSYTYRITELHYTYGNATLSAHYVGYLYFQNYWFTPNIWVSNLKGSLSWLVLATELHYTYGCLTLSLAYCC